MSSESEAVSDYEAGSCSELEDDTSSLSLDDHEKTGNLETELLQLEIETDCEVERKLELIAPGDWDVEKMLQEYEDVFESAAKLRYEDITSQFLEGNVFLMCGDSLLLNATRNGYCSRFGGQSLHLVYLCERLFQLFQRKGAIPEIVFFDIWRDVLVDESIRLARTILMHHLRENMSLKIHTFHATWDPKFTVFIDMQKPSFLLADLTLPDIFLDLQENCNISLVKLVLCAQVLHTISLNLPCASMEKIEVNVSTVHTFTVEGRPRLKKLLPSLLTQLQKVLPDVTHQQYHCRTVLNCKPLKDVSDIRHVVAVMAASCYLIEEKDGSSQDWVRSFLLYSSLMEVLPLRSRACDFPREVPSPQMMTFVQKIQAYMQYSLEHVESSSCSYHKVADLWHGNLFITTLRHQNCVPLQSLNLSPQTTKIYVRFIEEVEQVSGLNIEAFPSIQNSLDWCVEGSLVADGSDKPIIRRKGFNLDRLIPTSCHLTREFCGGLWNDVHEQALLYDHRVNAFIVRHSAFSEIRHWHSKKPITDEQDRIKTESVKPKDEWAKRKYDRYRNQFAKFMDIYGASIEGRKNIAEPIVSRHQTKSKRNSKIKKESKKATKIKEANLEKKNLEKRQKEEQRLKKFKEDFKKMKVKGKYASALEEAKILKENMSFPENIQQIYFFIAKCCYLLWCDECSTRSKRDRDLSFPKELFLSCRKMLQEPKSLSVSDKEEVGKWLCHLGFDEMALLLNLPRPENIPDTYHVGPSWVRFQLLHLGADLERSSDGSPDHRVDFIPDKWQGRLFDIIDRRESAIIVAPTSSGKTYACYYCMDTVLREDDEGVVVYVSPTKALVNQVAATVYSRFRGKSMPEGKAVYGMFTRDYRVNDMNCQILVTVPQCLEMLLLSPRRQAWVRKLRYVIFDEIHCLAGQAGGLSWESSLLMIRCPFLALSATIGNPHTMHKWLQNAENFKRERDELDGCTRTSAQNRDPYKVHLVQHNERHSDLKKYVYTPSKELLHIHPYAYIDETVIKEHKGIPEHLSLAAEETLQLYTAMEKVSMNNDHVSILKPEVHFSDQIFIKRSCVRNYENKLKAIVQEWAFQNVSCYNALIKHLRSPLESASNEESGFLFTRKHFLNLIDLLKKKVMFPSILFRYDRSELDFLFAMFVEHCRMLEITNEKADNSSKKNRVEDRKEKQLKAMYQSVKEGGDLIKNVPKSLKRRERPDRKSLGLLEESSLGSIRNVGFADERDVEFIEHRLIVSGHRANHLFPSGLRLGLGKHHAAMSAREKSAVEMLFRMRVLNAVLATGTLSLGIHMPCKTVIIGGNSPYINTLSYHQMSGRSGRRGYDTEGNVVFFGMGERKIRTLLTGKLPSMIGNFPLTVTMVLRLLLLVSDVTERGVSKEEAQKNALSRALMFLNCNLVYQNIPELKDQMKHFFAFSTQLLMLQGLLDDEGKPQALCSLITHLHYHEPGNLVLAYLLRSGALRRLCKGPDGKDKELKLVLLLSHLFARVPLHPRTLERDFKNSKVLLPDLPEEVAKDIQNYNEEVQYIYDHYFHCVASNLTRKFGEDNALPLSGVNFEPSMFNAESSYWETSFVSKNVPRNICSRFAALSGHTDRNLYSRNQVIPNIRHGVFTDVKVVPLLDCSVRLNAFAWDFYNHGVLSAIVTDNGIKLGDAYTLLQDFSLMLQAVYLTMEELGVGNEQDPIIKTLGNVRDKFYKEFQRVFSLKE